MIFDLGKHEDEVECVAVSATYTVSSSYKNIKVWSLEKRVQVHSFRITYVNRMTSIQILKDEEFILFNGSCSELILWDSKRKTEKIKNIKDETEFYKEYAEFLSSFNFFNEIRSSLKN